MRRLCISLYLLVAFVCECMSQEIVVHRGANALAPENTLASADSALSYGATWVEVDVRTSKDGVLFNKDLSTLICYPCSYPETEYTVPSGVSRIEDYSFYGVTNLQEIIIPSSVTTISNNVFYRYSGKITINKPKGSISGAPWGAISATVNWQ